VVGSSNSGDVNTPVGNLLGTGNPATFQSYKTALTNPLAIAPTSITNQGGNQPHSNLQPYLVLNICIALQGIFPSRN
jgi:microcystin-dependent protein